jgi:hypothetical protein
MDLLTTYTQLGTTSNYSAIANLHTSQITTATAKPFLVCCTFISLYLATASNSADSSAWLRLYLHSHPFRNQLNSLLQLSCEFSARTAQQTSFFYCCFRVRCSGNMFTELFPTNGRSSYIENTVIILLRTCMLRTLRSRITA